MIRLTLEDLILKEDPKGILKFTDLNLSQSPKLSKNCISKLNKLVSSSQTPIDYYLTGLIYLVYLNQTDLQTADESLISVTTSNILFSILEKIKGTRLSNKLLPYLIQILDVISNKNEDSDYNMIENLVKENNNFCFSKILTEIDEDESYKTLINQAKEDKIQALYGYVNLMNSCFTLHEQMILFTEKSSLFFSNLLFEIPNQPISQNIEFLHNLTKFLDSIVYEYSYELDIDKEILQEEDGSVCKTFSLKTEQKKPNIEKEKITVEFKYEFLNELLQQSPNFCSSIYPLLNFLIENILAKKEAKSILDSNEQEKKSEILRIIVSIMNRIYFNFPYENERLFDKILLIFKEIDESLNFYEEAKAEAAKFLTRLIKNNESEKSEQFSQFNFIYSKLKIPGNSYLSTTTINDLSIKDGFPLNMTIDAGGSFEQILEVWLDFDEIEPKEVVLLKCDKMNFENNAYRLTLLMKRTGLYRINFDNNHSWFTEKQLRYRIFVLEPVKSNAKYAFPFHDLTRNDENFKGKLKVEEKNKSKYFVSDYKAVMLLDQKGLHFLANQPNKSYEMNIEIEQLNVGKCKERVINALKKTFAENLNEFFKNKLLSFAFVHNSNIMKNEEKKEEMIPVFYAILEELKINLKESVIDGKEILIEMIKKHINYNKTMIADNILVMFADDENLNVRLLNNLKMNYADLVYNTYEENIFSFRKAFNKNEKNKSFIAFLCLFNALICLGIENVKTIIINKPGILELENMNTGIPHEEVFFKALKEMELESLEEIIKKIDFSYLNIFIKIDDLILL